MKKTILLLLFSPWAHAFVTVGTDNDCNYSPASLEFAIQTNDEVRVTNQVTYGSIEIINRSAHVVGGFDNCSDAINNVPGNDKTQLSGSNSETVIRLATTAAGGHFPRTVHLENIEIHSGLTSSPSVAGGVNIAGNMTVTLESIEVRDNQANSFGGGIYITGLNGASLTMIQSNVHDNNAADGGGMYITSDAAVTLINNEIKNNNATVIGGGISINSAAKLNTINSKIVENTTDLQGAGISCTSSALVDMDDTSRLTFNASENVGGGLYATSGCQFKITAGDNSPIHQSNFGIRYNTSGLYGGGMYVHDATVIIQGNENHYANVVMNRTLHDNNNGRGGAIYATGDQAIIRLINARVNSNISDIGSAIFLTNGAYMNMKRSTGQCFGNQLCSEVFDNEATFSGTVVASNCATAEIYQTTFRDNIAPKSAVLGLYGDGQNDACESTFEGNLVYNNQDELSETTSLFTLNSQSTLNFAFNTVSDNLTDYVFLMDSFDNTSQSLKINNSIIWNAPAAVIGASTPNHQYSGNCFIVPNPQQLPQGFGAIISGDDPLFDNPIANIYELTLFSPPLDYCDTSLYQPKHHDILGVPRGFQVTAPILGTYDMGAFEFNNVNNNDVIFYDIFE